MCRPRRFLKTRYLRIWVLLALLAPGSVVAQVGELGPEELKRRIIEEEREQESRIVGFRRVRLSLPQRLSVGVGALFSRQPTRYHCTSVCEFRGWLVQAEPGISGGQISAGWAAINAEKGSNDFFLSKVFLSWGFRGTVLRTWGNADLNPPDQTLIGAEADFTVIRVNFSLGVFRHVGGGDPNREWIVGGGVGWEF